MCSQAVLMPNWIGDLLLALSVAERKKAVERNDLSLVVPERFAGLAGLLCGMPVIPYCRSTCSDYFASLLSVKSFSKLYILPHSFSSALFGFLSRIPARRGIAVECRSLLLTERLPCALVSRARHVTCEYSDVLETLHADPSLWEGKTIGRSREHAGSIVLCPGAAYGPAKQWPYFDRLPALLPDRKIVVLGDRRDAGIGRQVAMTAPQRITTLTGATSLEEAASIIAAASVLISNDSGLLHLAGFLGTPAVGIYGSSSPVWTRPLGRLVRAAVGSCSRSPCFERTCPLRHCNCLRNITPEMVAALAEEITR